MLPRLANGYVVELDDLEFELSGDVVSEDRPTLEGLHDDVLRVAALSRGWDWREHGEFFRRHFKAGPLYHATALGLVRREGQLVGIAGAVTDWQLRRGSIVHLCSLGLLPEVQNRGLLVVLLGLLWKATLARETNIKALEQRKLFASAITQSPFIIYMMQRLADVFPSPDRAEPSADEVHIAEAVVGRFDPELPLDPGLVLREECLFRYRSIPYSLDRRLNRLCDERLRYDQGDVFVAVGRVEAARLAKLFARVESNYPEEVRRLGAHVWTGEPIAPLLKGARVSAAEGRDVSYG